MIDPFESAPADEAQAAPATQEPEFYPPPAEEPPAPTQAASAPAEPQRPIATARVDVKPTLLPLDEGKVTITLKGDGAPPWIVIHAKDLRDAHDQLHGENAGLLAEIMDRTQKVGAHFAGLVTSARTQPANQTAAAPAQRQAAPQAAREAPNGEKRYCAHGEMKFVSEVSKKTGKPYSAFFCTSGDRNNECKAQFLR